MKAARVVDTGDLDGCDAADGSDVVGGCDATGVDDCDEPPQAESASVVVVNASATIRVRNIEPPQRVVGCSTDDANDGTDDLSTSEKHSATRRLPALVAVTRALNLCYGRD